MTDNEIRIACGKAAGWVDIVEELEPVLQYFRYVGRRQAGTVPTLLPDYPADLNACHELEKLLDDNIEDASSQRYVYANWLYRTVVPTNQQPIRATARQRCEAFLRTIGKWKE